MQDVEGAIILATSSSNTAFAIGNGYGKPFRDEEQAQRRADKLERKFPLLDFLVLDIKSSGRHETGKDFEF